jgi:UDP-GlcNAc:undecaprenyl-phosphate GlcNAc-1-phosphate transferase
MIFSLVFFAVGFLIAVLTTPWVIRLADRRIGIDHADQSRKNHAGTIVRLGGLPIMASLSICLFAIFVLEPSKASEWLPVLVGALLMYGLGLADDLKPIGARKKLIGQICIASLVFALGLSVDRVTYPGGGWSVELGASSYLVTILWLIAVPNVVNLIDGLDGIAAGLGMLMAVTLGVVGLQSEQLAVAWFAFTLAGAALGFLVFNFPPAKIFLGDGGAYLIGYSIAALSLTSYQKGSVGAVLLVTVIGLGVPIVDTSFTLARRAFRGFPLFGPDDEHLHHRLERLGFSKRRIVLGIYGVCVVLSLVGLSVFWSHGQTLPIAFGTLFLLAVASLRYLHYINTLQEMKARVTRTFSRRPIVRYALLQAQVLELEVSRCEDAAEFWSMFDLVLHRVGFVDQFDRNPETCHEINVKYGSGGMWTLWAPRKLAARHEWQRIAECFRPAYAAAVKKWHSEYAPAIPETGGTPSRSRAT